MEGLNFRYIIGWPLHKLPKRVGFPVRQSFIVLLQSNYITNNTPSSFRSFHFLIKPNLMMLKISFTQPFLITFVCMQEIFDFFQKLTKFKSRLQILKIWIPRMELIMIIMCNNVSKILHFIQIIIRYFTNARHQNCAVKRLMRYHYR